MSHDDESLGGSFRGDPDLCFRKFYQVSEDDLYALVQEAFAKGKVHKHEKVQTLKSWGNCVRFRSYNPWEMDSLLTVREQIDQAISGIRALGRLTRAAPKSVNGLIGLRNETDGWGNKRCVMAITTPDQNVSLMLYDAQAYNLGVSLKNFYADKMNDQKFQGIEVELNSKDPSEYTL